MLTYYRLNNEIRFSEWSFPFVLHRWDFIVCQNKLRSIVAPWEWWWPKCTEPGGGAISAGQARRGFLGLQPVCEWVPGHSYPWPGVPCLPGPSTRLASFLSSGCPTGTCDQPATNYTLNKARTMVLRPFLYPLTSHPDSRAYMAPKLQILNWNNFNIKFKSTPWISWNTS